MRKCLQCSGPIPDGSRRDRKFCCTPCYSKYSSHRPSFPYERNCKGCGVGFVVADRADANRQYCGKRCAKEASRKGSQTWHRLHPESSAATRKKRKKKDPHFERDKRRLDRAKILEMLGGGCVVCGTDNPSWLHVDYIPTCRDERHRHSRTLRFVSANVRLFRVLCANHHYELSITGKIEGTDIVQ